jgi:hypothetical protein
VAWRHLLASTTPDDQRRLENGLLELHRHRDGAGRWKRFPFFYTLLALSEIELPGAREEVRYAGAVIERSLRRFRKANPQDQSELDRRRRVVLERVSEIC